MATTQWTNIAWTIRSPCGFTCVFKGINYCMCEYKYIVMISRERLFISCGFYVTCGYEIQWKRVFKRAKHLYELMSLYRWFSVTFKLGGDVFYTRCRCYVIITFWLTSKYHLNDRFTNSWGKKNSTLE